MSLDTPNDRSQELTGRPASLPLGDAVVPEPPPARVRRATSEDRRFVVEMARLACVIEDRPLPEPTAPEVTAMLPGPDDVALLAVDAADRPIGAAWWSFREPPLVTDAAGNPVPEMTLAVAQECRGRGVGTSLIEALASEAARRFGAISLNVHIRNPAARLYSRTGFQVAGKGRGPLGVAMVRALGESEPPR
jgi:GNAT superfamily N-acetyltransferase